MTDPIFVTGADRSGTSLLYALLGSHPSVSMVRRTNLFRWFYDQFGDLSDPSNFDRCLTTLARYERLEPLQPDPDRIRAEFAQGEPTYGRLFELLHRPRAERTGKQRWGDKSLHTEHFANDVFTEFPGARMVHVMRDPRDRHASVMRRYDRVEKGVGSVTARWAASASAALRNTRRFGDRYLVVRYEDLVIDTVPLLTQVCAFIGEKFDPQMLTMQGVPEHEAGNSSFESFEPGTISARAIGRYKGVLATRDVAFIEFAVGRHMRMFGYTMEGVGVSWRDVPYVAANSARMLAWRFAVGDRNGNRQHVPEARLRPRATP